MTDAHYAEALRLIRKHMQPGDTVGMMFMRVAKELEVKRPAVNAAALTKKLIQAAVDYEKGRCGQRELSDARAAVETAITSSLTVEG